jgi:hypothetical protein
MIQDYESEGHRVVVAAVDVEIPSGKAKRINVTLPEYISEAADRRAKTHGENRPCLLANAAMDYISRHS